MIYILEDDDNIRKLINYSLTNQGFEIVDFSLPSEFWAALENEKPDLFLLDIMLPEEDGISILKKLRADSKTSSIPVIMLTAKNSEYDMITGLDAGADDYITKPFGMMTLISRIRATLRRYERPVGTREVIEAGGIKVDENQHTVFAGDRQIFLTVKEYDLLVLLIKQRGNVMTRDQLIRSVWELSPEIESRTVDVHIRALRAKLGEYEKNIETIRGVGYKFK